VDAKRGTLLQVAKPILEAYPDSPVALVGCRALGIGRTCCEYDLVVVSDEPRERDSVRFGEAYLDIFFLSEKEALRPGDPELAVSMAHASTVRDTALLLSSGCSAAQAVLPESARKSAQGRLASSLKAMGRADEAISKGSAGDADFWLLAAAYDFAFAWLYSAEVKPAPSHLLEQLRENSRGHSGRFEAFSMAAGLERASRADCGARLESMAVLYDTLDLQRADPEAKAGSGRTSYEIASRKASFLTAGAQLADCYAFLGHEVICVLPKVLAARQRSKDKTREPSLLVSLLSEGQNKVVSETVIRGLGLVRPRDSVQSALGVLREQVSELARTT